MSKLTQFFQSVTSILAKQTICFEFFVLCPAIAESIDVVLKTVTSRSVETFDFFSFSCVVMLYLWLQVLSLGAYERIRIQC